MSYERVDIMSGDEMSRLCKLALAIFSGIVFVAIFIIFTLVGAL